MARDRRPSPRPGAKFSAAVALVGIVVLTAVAASRGWVWAIVAWFGSSLVTFAIATATANQRAVAAEDEERQLLEQQAFDDD